MLSTSNVKIFIDCYQVNELQEEAESHKLVRRDSELKVQALSQRMLTVEGIAGNLMAEDFQLSR